MHETKHHIGDKVGKTLGTIASAFKIFEHETFWELTLLYLLNYFDEVISGVFLNKKKKHSLDAKERKGKRVFERFTNIFGT